MIYSKTMNENSTDWAQASTFLGLILAALIGFNKWISENFRSKKEAREAENKRRESELSDTITRAVQSGLAAFNKEIREELKNHREETNVQIRKVHERIDDALNHKEK